MNPSNPGPWQNIHPTTPMNVLDDQSLPLGQQLLRAGLITQSQLAQALREQRETFMKFGEVCLIHRWISVEDLYRYTASHLLSLGEILIALKYIDIDQLKSALAQQRRFGRKLGEILLWKSWVTEEHLTYALRVQQYLRQAATANAWDALQYYLQHNPSASTPAAAPLSAPIPGPVIEEVVAAAPPTPQAVARPMPAAAASTQEAVDVDKLRAQITAYRNKIASLELQLEMQQQEWDALSLQMSQQVADYQAQYEQRIQQLEQSLQASQTEHGETAELYQRIEHLQTELELFQGYEQKYQLLLKQQQSQTQELTQARFRIQQLEGELRLAQVAMQEKERAIQAQQTLAQQLEEHKQRLKQWEAEIKRAQRIEHEFEQLQQQYTLAVQELELLRSQASQWQELLQAQQEWQAQREQLQTQLSQMVSATEYASLKAERDILQRQLAESQHSPSADLEREVQSLRQHIQYVEAERDALAQQLTALPGSSRHGQLSAKLTQLQELLTAYRRSLEDVQAELATQKQLNRCLQARLEQQEAVLDVARVELRSSASLARRLQERLDAERSGQGIEQALHWAERLLNSLQAAALISPDQHQQILHTWQEQGGELSRVVATLTGLHPQTIQFFSDEGYLARLLGCRRIGEYLRAAGLVTKEDVEEALQMIPPATRLGEALSQRGVLNPATADYFAKTFTGQSQGDDPN
ncbi:MAG: hypothetical protein Q6K99_05575 [Thermostichales cyanobacterium BF4_bins_65]